MKGICIQLRTEGRSITVGYAKLRRHPEIGCEMANLDLMIGGHEVGVKFESWDEMIDFCTAHNFKYEDQRSLGYE